MVGDICHSVSARRHILVQLRCLMIPSGPIGAL